MMCVLFMNRAYFFSQQHNNNDEKEQTLKNDFDWVGFFFSPRLENQKNIIFKNVTTTQRDE